MTQQAVLPTIPAGEPTIEQLNAQAQQLVGTAFTRYGGLPNPRAAVEALQSNSAPAVSAAMQVGSSSFDSILNSAPIAAPLQNVLTQRQPQPQQPQQSLQQEQQQTANAGDWRSLNDMPVADTRWLSALMQSGDTSRIKAWQQYLNTNNWYSGQNQIAVSGHWDTTSQAALYSFLIARFTPTALYSQDQATQSRANTFLSALGFDAQGLNAQQGSDPQWKSDIVLRWMHTHGPDTTMRNSLDEWSQQYGDANMPDAIRGLKEQWWQHVTDGIPFVGQMLPWSSGHTAGLSSAQLTDAEKAALAPALQDAHNNMGIFGVLNGYDQFRTRAVLGARYFFGDLFGQGKLENPWDTNNSTGKFIDAHANNVFAGLFGDDIANKYPGLAQMGNLFINIADDPISYTGVGLDSKLVSVGGGTYREATTLGKGMTAARGLMLKPTVMRDAFSRGELASHVLDTVLRPMDGLRREMATMLGEPGWNTLAKATALLGERNPARLPIVQQILDAPDAGRRMLLLQEHYGYKIYDPSFAMNMMQAMKSFSPAHWARLTDGKQARLWWGGVGNAANRGRQVNIDDPFDLRDAVYMQGLVHGMPEQQVADLMDKALAPDMVTRSNVVRQMNKAIRDGLEALPDKGAGFKSFVQTVRGGARRGFTGDDQRFYLAIKDPGSGAITEGVRRGAAQLTPEVHDILLQSNMDYEAAVTTLKDHLVELKQEVGTASPEMAHAQALVEQQIADLREAQTSASEAAFSPQFNMWERWEYTPYEMLAWKSPVLRNADYIQRKLRIDNLMGLWKRAVLMKPASSLSITLGDETTRFVLDLVANGHPIVAARYFVDMVKTMLKKGDIAELPQDLAFNAAKVFGTYSWDDHIPYDIGSEGYVQAATHYFNNLVAGGPEAAVWTKAMKEAGPTWQAQRTSAQSSLVDWLRSDDENAREFLRRAGVDLAKPLTKKRLVPIARQIHGSFMAVTRYARGSREDMFNWVDRVANGGKRFSDGEARRLIHDLRQRDPDALVPVVGRRMYAPGSPGASPMSRFSNWYFHHITDAMVNNQRRVGYGIKVRQYEQRIRSFHGGDWTDAEIRTQAAAEARQWVQKNTYQGMRSMTATALRNVTPFFGATANMSRFFMREWARHPATIDPSMRFLEWQTQNDGNGGLHIPVPGLTNLLSMFGFNSGDDLTFDPAYAFFFSRDGLAGFTPGLGPIAMAPVKLAAQANPDVANILKEIPGFQYVDFNSPMIPWAERLASAVSIAQTGKSFLEGVPFLGRPTGYYERQELDAAQQQHAQFLEGQRSQDVSEGSVRAQVGAETGLLGVLSAGLPIGATMQDPLRAKLTPAVQAFDLATSDAAKLQVIQQHPDAAPLLLYYRPELWNQLHPDQPMQDSDVKRTLTADNPWLQPYATGKVASDVPGVQSGAELSTLGYEQDLAAGRLRYLETPEFIAKMFKNDSFNDAWSQYETVHHANLNWLLQTGNAPTSQAAQIYKQTVVDPAIEQIGATHPDWYAQFVQQTDRSFSGLEVQSAPLRSLMSWEVMPAFDDLESANSNLWRQALVYRDNAATALLSARGNSGEQQLILYALQQQMQALAAQDTTGAFAAQLNRFSFSKLSDLTNLEEQQLYARALAGLPTSVT